MKRYIRASLNSELSKIRTSSINRGGGSDLDQKLKLLLYKIPTQRYVLSLGERGYSTGYYKKDAETLQWLYNNESRNISSYWDTDCNYIVLPEQFSISDKIHYEDDCVVVYEISENDKLLYSGSEDYDPMKRDSWKYCSVLGLYYFIDYISYKIYVKWKI